MDKTALSNGQSKSLSDYIQGNGYQTVSLDASFVEEGGDALAETLNPEPDDSTRRLTTEALEGVQTGEGLSPADPNASATAGPGSQPGGATTQLTPELQAEQSRIEAERLALERDRAALTDQAEQTRRREAAQAAENEKQRFLQYYNGLETDADRRAALFQFQAYKAQQRAQAAEARVQEREQYDQLTTQQIAKKQVIFLTMQQEKIPAAFQPFLEKAENATELDNMVAQVKNYLQEQNKSVAESNRQQRIQSGVDVAGGVNAGFVPPAAPKKRSGDLLGLIGSRQFQVVNAMVEPTG